MHENDTGVPSSAAGEKKLTIDGRAVLSFERHRSRNHQIRIRKIPWNEIVVQHTRRSVRLNGYERRKPGICIEGDGIVSERNGLELRDVVAEGQRNYSSAVEVDAKEAAALSIIGRRPRVRRKYYRSQIGRDRDVFDHVVAGRQQSRLPARRR